jgi:hypothetical protein
VTVRALTVRSPTPHASLADPAYKRLMTMRKREDAMSVRIELACTVCSEEFIVPIEVYKAHSSVVQCPCCGSTDLVLLVFDEGVTCHLGNAAA